MAGWDDVDRLALALPEATARPPGHQPENRGWAVRDKVFVWERPLRAKELRDLEALGVELPDGPVLGASVEHLGAKDALLAADPEVFFTTPHFDGYKAILVRLDRIGVPDLDEVVTEAWLARAPKRAVEAFLAEQQGGG